MRVKKWMVLTSLLLVSLPLSAATRLQIKKEAGRTEFVAIGNPGFLKINGKGAGPGGTLILDGKSLSGELQVDLTSLDTGMNLRNQHMKEKYLETKTHPVATLSIPSQELAQPWTRGQKIQGELKALLRLHGVEREVAVPYTLSESGQVTANFQLKITDFQIGIPSFMGVTVADSVEVKIQSQVDEGA